MFLSEINSFLSENHINDCNVTVWYLRDNKGRDVPHIVLNLYSKDGLSIDLWISVMKYSGLYDIAPIHILNGGEPDNLCRVSYTYRGNRYYISMDTAFDLITGKLTIFDINDDMRTNEYRLDYNLSISELFKYRRSDNALINLEFIVRESEFFNYHKCHYGWQLDIVNGHYTIYNIYDITIRDTGLVTELLENRTMSIKFQDDIDDKEVTNINIRLIK